MTAAIAAAPLVSFQRYRSRWTVVDHRIGWFRGEFPYRKKLRRYFHPMWKPTYVFDFSVFSPGKRNAFPKLQDTRRESVEAVTATR